jgi:rare lipoprotein A
MKRALLSALGAMAAVVLLAIPASASSYGWPTSYGQNEWMGGSFGRKSDDYTSETRSRGNRAEKKSRGTREASAPRGKRRTQVAARESGGSFFGGGQSGIASYYWQPQRVASGGWFNPNAMTAAHKTLPFGTKVRVTHQATGRSVTVTINDRGPYIAGRIIDLSSAAAGQLGMKSSGVARVNVTVLGR